MSADFISRIVGMIVLGISAVYLGISFGNGIVTISS